MKDKNWKFWVNAPEPFNSEKTEKRRFNEVITVLSMLEIYCKKFHKTEKNNINYDKYGNYKFCTICEKEAKQLIRQTEHCPHMAYKTFCHECPKPCHKPNPMIADMMRYSGPRLLFHHPIIAISHLRYLLHRRRVFKKYSKYIEANKK